jgi:peroxiredoxin
MALDPIQVGAEAPDFELPSSDIGANGKPGKKIRLSEFRGKKNVVLAFYPLDFSPVCTGENVCFQKQQLDFEGADAQILGISVDSAWAHAAFQKQLGLTYPLLADFHPKGEVAKSYGLYLEESGITARATVIVDKQGKVAWLKVQQIPEPRANKELLAALKALG